MKTLIYTLILLSLSLIFISLVLAFRVKHLENELAKKPVIELPEEYKAITIDDNLYGTYSNDTLRIFFNNGPKQ